MNLKFWETKKKDTKEAVENQLKDVDKQEESDARLEQAKKKFIEEQENKKKGVPNANKTAEKKLSEKAKAGKITNLSDSVKEKAGSKDIEEKKKKLEEQGKLTKTKYFGLKAGEPKKPSFYKFGKKKQYKEDVLKWEKEMAEAEKEYSSYSNAKIELAREIAQQEGRVGAGEFLLGQKEDEKKSGLRRFGERLRNLTARGTMWYDSIGTDPKDSKLNQYAKKVGKTVASVALIGGTSALIAASFVPAGIGATAIAGGAFITSAAKRLLVPVLSTSAMTAASGLPPKLQPFAISLISLSMLSLSLTSISGAAGLVAGKGTAFATKRLLSEKAIAKKSREMTEERNRKISKLDVNDPKFSATVKVIEEEYKKILSMTENRRALRGIAGVLTAVGTSTLIQVNAETITKEGGELVQKLEHTMPSIAPVIEGIHTVSGSIAEVQKSMYEKLDHTVSAVGGLFNKTEHAEASSSHLDSSAVRDTVSADSTHKMASYDPNKVGTEKVTQQEDNELKTPRQEFEESMKQYHVVNTNPVEHHTTEVKFEHGMGGIKAIENLQEQLHQKYGDDTSKATSEEVRFMKMSSVEIAKETGLYDPNNPEAESALIKEGATLSISDKGIILNNTKDDINLGTEKYSGDMMEHKTTISELLKLHPIRNTIIEPHQARINTHEPSVVGFVRQPIENETSGNLEHKTNTTTEHARIEEDLANKSGLNPRNFKMHDDFVKAAEEKIRENNSNIKELKEQKDAEELKKYEQSSKSQVDQSEQKEVTTPIGKVDESLKTFDELEKDARMHDGSHNKDPQQLEQGNIKNNEMEVKPEIKVEKYGEVVNKEQNTNDTVESGQLINYNWEGNQDHAIGIPVGPHGSMTIQFEYEDGKIIGTEATVKDFGNNVDLAHQYKLNPTTASYADGQIDDMANKIEFLKVLPHNTKEYQFLQKEIIDMQKDINHNYPGVLDPNKFEITHPTPYIDNHTVAQPINKIGEDTEIKKADTKVDESKYSPTEKHTSEQKQENTGNIQSVETKIFDLITITKNEHFPHIDGTKVQFTYDNQGKIIDIKDTQQDLTNVRPADLLKTDDPKHNFMTEIKNTMQKEEIAIYKQQGLVDGLIDHEKTLYKYLYVHDQINKNPAYANEAEYLKGKIIEEIGKISKYGDVIDYNKLPEDIQEAYKKSDRIKNY